MTTLRGLVVLLATIAGGACQPVPADGAAPAWQTPVVVGNPADWSRGSRLLVEKNARLRCLLPLPDGRGVRTVWDDPVEAWDVDAWTGRVAPAALLPERYAIGCPRLSPDGKDLLMTLERQGRRYVYWSSEPEGDRRVRVMEGGLPVWLASGAEWLLSADGRRAAVLSRSNRVRLLASEGSADRRIVDFAVGSDDDRLAVLYETAPGSDLELFNVATLQMVARLHLPGRASGLVFDGARRTFGFVLPENGSTVWVELEARGDVHGDVPRLVRRGGVPGARLGGAARVGGGMVVLIDRGAKREVGFVDGA